MASLSPTGTSSEEGSATRGDRTQMHSANLHEHSRYCDKKSYQWLIYGFCYPENAPRSPQVTLKLLFKKSIPLIGGYIRLTAHGPILKRELSVVLRRGATLLPCQALTLGYLKDNDKWLI